MSNRVLLTHIVPSRYVIIIFDNKENNRFKRFIKIRKIPHIKIYRPIPVCIIAPNRVFKNEVEPIKEVFFIFFFKRKNLKNTLLK